MAVYYLNRGLVLEEVICVLINEYFKQIDYSSARKNYRVEASVSHPFARLYLKENEKMADVFPSVTVTTATDDKTAELFGIHPISKVGFTVDDIDDWGSDTDDDSGKKIAGLSAVTSQRVKDELKQIAQKQGYVYGLRRDIRRTDKISVEIWATNSTVKNDIYEVLRAFIGSNLHSVLYDRYTFFDPLIEDETLHGERSNNYNIDFGLELSGAMLSFNVNYTVSQIVFNTEATSINDVIDRGEFQFPLPQRKRQQ